MQFGNDNNRANNVQPPRLPLRPNKQPLHLQTRQSLEKLYPVPNDVILEDFEVFYKIFDDFLLLRKQNAYLKSKIWYRVDGLSNVSNKKYENEESGKKSGNDEDDDNEDDDNKDVEDHGDIMDNNLKYPNSNLAHLEQLLANKKVYNLELLKTIEDYETELLKIMNLIITKFIKDNTLKNNTINSNNVEILELKEKLFVKYMELNRIQDKSKELYKVLETFNDYILTI